MMIFDISIAAACALNYDNKEDYQKIVFLVWLYTITKLKVMLIMNMVLGAVGAKEAMTIDKLVNFFDKFDPVTTAFLAALNLVLVFIVFRFTRKMSQSKLSISPETRKIILSSVEWEKMNKRQENNELNKKYVKNLNFSGEGFPIPNNVFKFNGEVLSIRVKNRGDLPSTNIKIVLTLKIYKTKVTYENNKPDLLDVIDDKRELYTTERYDIPINYIGADDDRVYELFPNYNDIREAELILEKIQANGHTYFRQGIINRLFNPTIIYHYEHPFMKQLGDTNDYMCLIGHRKLWEEENERTESRYETPFDGD